jgi:hypothetical protein
MATKTAQKKANDPVALVSWFSFPKPLSMAAPESATNIFFKGFDVLLDKYKDIDTDAEIADAKEKMSGALSFQYAETGAPFVKLSPITPEKAAEGISKYVGTVDAATAGAIAAMIAGEAASLGQVDVCLSRVLDHPIIAGAVDVARRFHSAVAMEGFYPAYRYKILKDFQPFRADVNIEVARRIIGATTDDEYLSLMEYLGFDADAAASILQGSYRAVSPSSVLELLRRGKIDVNAAKEMLRFNLWRAIDVDRFVLLSEERPEPYRLADFAVKGLIDNNVLADSFKWFGLDKFWADAWRESQYQYPSVNTVIELLRRGLISSDVAKGWLTRSAVPSGVQDALLLLTRNLVDARTLADLTAKGLYDRRVAESYVKGLGFTADDFNCFLQSAYRYPDFMTVLELYWRGFVDESTAKMLLRRLGYNDDVVNALFGLKDSIPSTSDLITMVVREAFVPEMVTPAPDIFAKYMSMRGFSKEWADRYWTAHWRPIDLERAYDNVRRGLKDKEWLKNVLKIQDVHPMWWDDIVNVMYNPPSIRELGYGWDVGVYTKDDIKKYRMWGGLSPEDADKSAEAMVAYRTEAERNAVRTELMYAYAQGRISRDDFADRLKELKTPDAAVDYWLRRGDLYKERLTWEPPQTESRSITRADATWAFMHGLRDESWFRQVLKNIGYTSDAIELYVAVAKQKLAEEQKPPEEPQPKRLTLSQIEDALNIGLIDTDEALKRIMSLGYSQADANIVLRIITYAPASAVRVKPFSKGDLSALYRYWLFSEEDLVDGYKEMGYDELHASLLATLDILDYWYPKLQSLYEKGAITIDNVISRLVDLGLRATDAQNIANAMQFEFSVERVKDERALTKSEIIKGVKNGVFSFEDGVQFLKDLGYNDSEARYILIINGIAAAGDPMGYWEMRRAIELMKKAQGKPYVEIPDEVVAQERMIEEEKQKIEDMRARGEKEEVIASELGVLARMEAAFRKLLKKYLLA